MYFVLYNKLCTLISNLHHSDNSRSGRFLHSNMIRVLPTGTVPGTVIHTLFRSFPDLCLNRALARSSPRLKPARPEFLLFFQKIQNSGIPNDGPHSVTLLVSYI